MILFEIGRISEVEAYTGFAEVYDTFMDNVPYEEWASYLRETLIRYEISDGLLLDLGCGTGTLTEILSGYGYDMIGVDNAEDMLDIAMEKRMESGSDILYLLQDMREFELYGTVRAIVSVCDSVNYITEPDELVHVFKLVNNYLDPKGIFIFDFNTEYKYKKILGNSTIAEEREECSFIWDNYYYDEEKINEYELTLFIKDEELSEECGQDICVKFQETHFQRAYTLEEIKKLLAQSGLEFIEAFDSFSKNEVSDESERICVVVRECGK